MKKLRVLVLMHEDLMPPAQTEGLCEGQVPPWKTEYDILWALDELGHDARPIGVNADLGTLRRAIDEFDPDVVFNVLEEFHGATCSDNDRGDVVFEVVLSYDHMDPQVYPGPVSWSTIASRTVWPNQGPRFQKYSCRPF